MKIVQSRNKREGVYAGWSSGMHFRLHKGYPLLSAPSAYTARLGLCRSLIKHFKVV